MRGFLATRVLGLGGTGIIDFGAMKAAKFVMDVDLGFAGAAFMSFVAADVNEGTRSPAGIAFGLPKPANGLLKMVVDRGD